MVIISFIFFCSLLSVGDFTHKRFLGCYEDTPTMKLRNLTEGYFEEDCVDKCYREYYPYALFRNRNECACSHFIGVLKNETRCSLFCPNCPITDNLRDVYFTGFKALGPPTRLTISNVTDTQFHISWDRPEFANGLLNYIVSANVIKSYSSVPLKGMSWKFSNETFQNDLSSLHPGTNYNVSVRGVTSSGPGIETYQLVETKIGKPSDDPEAPKVIQRDKTTMKIEIKPVTSDNGPISSYLIILSNRSSVQTVDFDNLMSITRALDDGLSYYVTAEVPLKKLNDTFIIGDGQIYGDYYNAPLSPSTSYDVLLGVTSRKDDIELKSFSPLTIPALIHDMKEEVSGSNSLLITLISVVCCGICIASLIFIIVKYRLVNNYRLHSNDSQELHVRSPAIDVENHGYIPEENADHVNYYEELRKQVWMIPHQLLKVDYIKVLGQGKFGFVYKGTLEKDLDTTDVLVYSIADRALKSKERQEMLRDLRLLIKCGKHKNVLEFIGTCENLESICITMEYHTMSLKDYLLTSRVSSGKSYSTLNDIEILQIAISIAEGLYYLHTRNLIHKQLCARHVAIVGQSTPKIMGYGLATYYNDNRIPNMTRWTAREILHGEKHSIKSDVWSLACLIWEMCALGGTPHASVGNNEVVERIIKGCTLPKLVCMDQEFYQTLLDCWQISTDERPHAIHLQQTLEFYVSDSIRHYLNFTMDENDDTFKYEQYIAEYELYYPVE